MTIHCWQVRAWTQAVLACLLVAGLHLAAAEGPRLIFQNPVYEFGTVNAGKIYDHRFWFTNTGNQTLEITNVFSTCGCTTLEGWPRTLEAGAAGSLAIKFHSARVAGNIQKAVVVYSNDPQQPIYELTVKGRVGQPIEYGPKWAYFNVPAGGGTPAPASVGLTNNAKEPLAVFNARGTNGAFAARVVTNRDGYEYRIEVTTAGRLPLGVTRGAVTVQTSSPDLPVITIPTMANVQSALSVLPGQLLLAPSPLRNASTNALVVQYSGSTPLTISEGSVNAPGVTVQTRPLQGGRATQVTLVFPVGFNAPAGCEFTAKTTDPQRPLIKVPITHSAPRTP